MPDPIRELVEQVVTIIETKCQNSYWRHIQENEIRVFITLLAYVGFSECELVRYGSEDVDDIVSVREDKHYIKIPSYLRCNGVVDELATKWFHDFVLCVLSRTGSTQKYPVAHNRIVNRMLAIVEHSRRNEGEDKLFIL